VDGSRRALYDYVRRADRPVSREQAADATHMSRGLAAFHLDKLVHAGLLRARYEAPVDQPRGRGRAPKVYEAAGEGLTVSIPQRRYELIAEILADAVVQDPAHANEAARRCAHQRGHQLGRQLRDTGADLETVLTGLGFEPEHHPDLVLLHNCPFHALAARHTALVCGLNHTFLAGLVEGLGATAQTRLAPRPGACCVELATVAAAGPPGAPTTARPHDAGPPHR
jgi:predicted ArsR family transcriptional regulator